MLNNRQRALVLGGGGFVASSWIAGLITGMAESGIDVRDADVLIGTSSGARVAWQLASGAPLEEVFARQIGAASHVGRQSGAVDRDRLQREVARAKELGGDRAEILRRYGQLALTLAGPDRRAGGTTQVAKGERAGGRRRRICVKDERGVPPEFGPVRG